MAKISLSFFTIKIFRLNEKKEPVYLKINNKNSHTDVNLLECIYGFLKSKSRSYDDDKVNEKIYKPTHIETKKLRYHLVLAILLLAVCLIKCFTFLFRI